MTTQELISHIRVIPDFPVKGIMFQDITTLLQDPACFKELSDRLYEQYKDKGISKVVGLESRGFIMSAVLAYRLGAGLVLVRKAGKLPGETLSEAYDKEYGQDSFELHTGSIEAGDVILLHDDILATGGTISAAYKLCQHCQPAKTYVSFIINLTDCPRTASIPSEAEVYSVLELEEHSH